MSKAGYGTPEEILKTRVDLVIYMIEYEKFSVKYEAAFIELNTENR